MSRNCQKVYVASSWRNERQPEVVQFLREKGFDVYDFKDPKAGFHWSQIDPNYENWTAWEYLSALESDLAKKGFDADYNALEECDVCVLVLPCGASAHAEAGFMAGRDKPVYVLLDPDYKPELMYRLFDGVTDSIEVLPSFLHSKCDHSMELNDRLRKVFGGPPE